MNTESEKNEAYRQTEKAQRKVRKEIEAEKFKIKRRSEE